jgi:protease-4
MLMFFFQKNQGSPMSTETDLLIERRKTRRQSLFWKAVAAILVTVVVAMLAAGGSSSIRGMGGMGSTAALSSQKFGSDHIARLNVEGIILEDRWRAALIDDLKNDNNVQGVVVYINSPGGAVVGGEDLYRNLLALGEEKPVVAVLGSVAASAGYMTAISAERIFAREGTITGSIGVLFESTEITGLLKKIGVKAELVKSAPLKAQPNPLEPFSDTGRAAIKSVVMDMYDMFVDMVIERRKLDKKQVLKLADGRIFTGRQAVKNGLVDAIGGEKEAVVWMETEKGVAANLPVLEAKPNYPKQDFFNKFFGAAGKALASERLTLDGLLSVWHPVW